MTLARLLRVFLAVALLAAWQNSLVHPITHVDEAGQHVHLEGGHDGGEHGGGATLACDAIAAVAIGVGGPAGFELAAPLGAAAPLPTYAAAARAAVFHAYRSQAPPQHS
jgi:hypothetical protein